MAKRRANARTPIASAEREFAGFVEHPRYGKRPRLTGLDVFDSGDGRVCCHWHSPPGVRVPNTAVMADVSRQAKATVHVTHYFDAKRVCRKCRQPFLFFADEQKHWYEELQFPLEADCLECHSCRKGAQRLRALRRKYEELVQKADRNERETLQLIECAAALVESAVFSAKLLPTLRGLLKPLTRDAASPGYTKGQALLSTINALESASRARA